MPAENNLKRTVKEPVKNLVKEVVDDIIYRIAKAGTKRTINELKQELKEKSIRRLQRKLETLSERQLDKRLNKSTERISREITQEGIQREDLIREIEQGFRHSFRDKLVTLSKAPVLKIAAVTTVCIIAVGAGVYAAVDRPWERGNGPGPTDTISPKVTVYHTPRSPEPGQRVTFTVEAGDNVRIERIELLVNGQVVEITVSSPLVFVGGPYDEGTTVRYGAYAYDEAGNRAWSGEQSLQIGVDVGPRDTIPPEVIVRHNPQSPEPGQRVTFVAEAGDNVGIERIELLVNGQVVETAGSSPLVFEGGPYDEGTIVHYSAYAYDEAGNRAWSREESLQIAVSESIDTIPPKVMTYYNPQEPGPDQRVTFTVEAEDNVRIERIELLVNGQVVRTTGSSPLVFVGGPYDEGTIVRYSAYAYDEAGNRAWSGEESLQIAVPMRYPDLVIVKVWHEWIEPPTGFCVIHYIIQNRGESETGSSSTKLIYKEKIIEWDDVGPLAPGQTIESEFPYQEMPTAGFVVELCADGREVISEENENNNCWVYTYVG